MLNNVRAEVAIDLAEYGGEGELIMAYPSLRSQTLLRNKLSKFINMETWDPSMKEVQLREDANIGDYMIYLALAYVRKAPFPVTLEGFLDYSVKLDDASPGNGEALLNRMYEAKAEIEEGKVSPSQPSPESGTPSSE